MFNAILSRLGSEIFEISKKEKTVYSRLFYAKKVSLLNNRD